MPLPGRLQDPPTPAPAGIADADAALLDCAAPEPGDHALIIGRDTLGLLCGLIRRGCTVAATLRPNQRAESGTTDLAIIPTVDSLADAERAIAQSSRALSPAGRIVLRAPAGDPSGRLATGISRALHAHGFSRVRRRLLGGATVVSAERPCFAPIGRA